MIRPVLLIALMMPLTAFANGGDMQFATQLYSTLRQQPGNVFFSPASIRLAMAMAYGGARGETATQLRAVLGMADGKAAHDDFNQLLRRWDELGNPTMGEMGGEPSMKSYYDSLVAQKRIALSVVNRLWAQTGTHLRADYLALLQNSYRGPLTQLDFGKDPEAARAAINRWVSDETKKKIPQLLPPRSVNAGTRLVLTNAIYFKASWQNKFEKSGTQSAPFHAPGGDVKVQMMDQVGHFQVGAIDGGQILEMPYGAGDLAMDVVLPSKNDGLAALETALDRGALEKWLTSLHSTRAHVSLPRWKTSSALQLADALKTLGAKLAFQYPGADFSGIDDSKDLYISAVIHQAVIEVDEEGTEAAAATAVMMEAGSAAPTGKPIEFRADRPFVYLIRDTKTGTILFLGRLQSP